MIELMTLLLLSGALLYRLGLSMFTISMISALTSAFFFIYFLSRKGFLLGAMIASALVAGAMNMHLHDVKVPPDFFISRTVTGTVQGVDRRLDKTVIVIKDAQYKKLLQVTAHSSIIVLPGDTINVRGSINHPEDFMTDTGRMFPYQKYLLSKNIAATVPLARIATISSGHFSLTRFATVARFRIADIFTRFISFPTDGLVAGMLVGYQGGIPSDIQDLFRTTGVLHVLVLSGENITLLAVFLGIVLRPLPFMVRVVLTAAAIILIVLISGAGVAAVRAGVMGCIALSAGVVRRSYIPLRALTVSILFFFFYSPETIFTDPGFHLSVLATIFMVLVMPKIEHLFHWLSDKYGIRELTILALCVPVFMLPYTMYFSGLVPLASPFANILMALMTSFFMLAGAIILTLSWCSPIAQFIGTLTSFAGSTVIKMLKVCNHLPQLNTPPLAWWGAVGAYLLFFSIVFRLELRQFWHGLKNSFLPQTSSSEPRNQ